MIYFNKLIEEAAYLETFKKIIFAELPGKLKVVTNWIELFFRWSFEICQLRVLNSFIPYSKVNSMENILKFRLAYLETSETSMMKLFCEYIWILLVVHCFYKNVPSCMFHRVLYVSLMSKNFQKHLLKCWYSECYYNQNLTVSNSPKLRGLVFFECDQLFGVLIQLNFIILILICF